MKIKILDIGIDKVTMAEAVEKLSTFLKGDRLHMVFTPNPEMIMAGTKDQQFHDILNEADLVVPDGIGVVIGAKLLGTPLKERVAGYDMVQNLFKATADKGTRFYFLGAAPGVALKAKEAMEAKYPAIQIVGVRDGYFKEEDEAGIIKEINATSADVVLVAIGVPKQEKFIKRHQKNLQAKIAIGVGGSFDGMAGVVKRAPLFWQKIHLEWFYRLVQQPSRAKRMVQLPIYLLEVLKSKRKRKRG